MRRRRSVTQGRRDESGETLALLVVWPALLTAILLMLVHAFIVTNARAEAELAASQGLRSAWRAAAESDFLTDPDNPPDLYTGDEPHPEVLKMAEAAKDAVARTAATEGAGAGGAPAQPNCTATGATPQAAQADRRSDGVGAGGGVGRGVRAAGRAVAQPLGPGLRVGAGAGDPGGAGPGEPRVRGSRATACLLTCARPSAACA